MEDKTFAWTSELTQRLFELRFENDWLFKKKKQPWGEFRDMLLLNGFPEEMSVKHVRKKWSYTYDMYKIAKKTKNRNWKYYKLFDKHYAKSKTLDKYESWSNEWRLKLITCIIETKGLNLDFQTMWRTVERAMRCQDLPSDCCVQDMKGLWQHIRTTFNRKHRLKIKKGAELTAWPLYDVLLNYFKKFEPDHLINLENESAYIFMRKQRDATKYYKRKKRVDTDDNDNENEFQWSKDITESFIQIRLQNDWLFRERKWAWSDLLKIMLDENGFPKTLTSREICRKWASTFGEYQKAKATNNKSWVYYNIFELYLGEGSLSLNPLVDWQEEWVFNLISARTNLDHMFKNYIRNASGAWREVEKRLRSIGLPLDHSLLDLPEIWTHLTRTFRWKKKFANKGILTEHWPFYEAMSRYVEIQEKRPVFKRKLELSHSDDGDLAHDDDFEDDMKLFDLKQKLQVKPNFECEESNRCRSCYTVNGSVDVFGEKDIDGVELSYKLKVIGGIDVDKSDRLPSQICFNCLLELENAYKFRRKCQESDKKYRNLAHKIKIEILEKMEGADQTHGLNDNALLNNDVDIAKEEMDDGAEYLDCNYDSDSIITSKVEQKHMKKERRVIRKKKRIRKLKYDYSKICEICGKHTRNLVSHLDAHTNGKTYSCDVCNKKFKFKSGLIIHKAVHDPTPKKTCEVCGKTFHVVAQYRRHFVYHANERKYECETCGKRFNTSDILKVHNRTHTDERPFSCQECGKTFRTAGCVSRHRRIVHRNIKQKSK